MTIVRMRHDLLVLCPTHNTLMTIVQYRLSTAIGPESKTAYACEQPGCTYQYDIFNGYFTISESEGLRKDAKWRQTCPRDELPLYIAQFEPQKSCRTWRCAQLNCNGGRVTEGPPSAP